MSKKTRGDCVDACPKDLFSLQPASRRLWVACKSLDAGDDILDDCEVACTACGRCAMDAPGLIRMENNLPVVDYSRSHATQVPIQRCPTGAIVWLDPRAGAVKGPAAAKKIIRRGTAPEHPPEARQRPTGHHPTQQDRESRCPS